MEIILAKFLRLFAAIAVIIAIAVMGFAHKQSQTPLTPELAAYVAQGGSLGDLCGDFDEEHGHHGQKCEACRLVGAALLSPPWHEFLISVSVSRQNLPLVTRTSRATRRLDPARLTRAPPKA